jgi:hypothetical protein
VEQGHLFATQILRFSHTMPNITPTTEEEFDNDLFKGRVRPSMQKVSMPIAEPAAPAPEEGMALEDSKQIFSLKNKFERAAKSHKIPPEILEGMASRESRGGKSLDENGYDPEKKAFGVLQVDGRYHDLQGTESPTSQAHINQAAQILRDYRNQMDQKHPNWSDDDRWRAAVAAYNMGPGNVKSLDNLDKGTTGNNYSHDVMLRAKVFRDQVNQRNKK